MVALLNDSKGPELVVNFLVATAGTMVDEAATGVVEDGHALLMSKTSISSDAGISETPFEKTTRSTLMLVTAF